MNEMTELTLKVLNLQAKILELEERLKQVENENKLFKADLGWK